MVRWFFRKFQKFCDTEDFNFTYTLDINWSKSNEWCNRKMNWHFSHKYMPNCYELHKIKKSNNQWNCIYVQSNLSKKYWDIFFVGLALYVDLESGGKKWAISYIFIKINLDTSCNKLIITETEITNFIYKKKETIILFISLLKWISQYVWLTLNLGSSCNKLIIIETEITNFIYIKSRKQ